MLDHDRPRWGNVSMAARWSRSSSICGQTHSLTTINACPIVVWQSDATEFSWRRDMSFGNPEPLDPFYVKFRDGLTKWIIEKPQYPGLRWASWSDGG